MAVFKCKMCGGTLNIENGATVAECEFCGRKFGSIEEARKCETKHINDVIIKDLNKHLKTNF